MASKERKMHERVEARGVPAPRAPEDLIASVTVDNNIQCVSRSRQWYRVSPSEPCPICGKPNWCSRSADGIMAICRRVDTGAGVHRVDSAGADYWCYHIDSHSPCRQPLIEI